MKQIEKEILENFRTCKSVSLSPRDRVEAGCYRLWGYSVARLIDDKLVLFDCGWHTKTTASRINAFLSSFRAVHNGLPVCYRYGSKAGYYCGKTKIGEASVAVSVNLLDGEFNGEFNA